jgi:hypothetical protein
MTDGTNAATVAGGPHHIVVVVVGGGVGSLHRANRTVYVGTTYDFSTPGARKYVLSLDTPDDAARFDRRHRGGTGGRTAPDHSQRRRLRPGQDRSGQGPAHNPDRGPLRILPALPEWLSTSAEDLPRGLDMDVLTGAKVMTKSARKRRSLSS